MSPSPSFICCQGFATLGSSCTLLLILFLFLASYFKATQTLGDFALTYISSHIYKIEALLSNHNAMITPSKSIHNGLVSPNTHIPSFPISSTFLFILRTSLVNQGTYSHSTTQPKEATACSGSAPRVAKPYSGVCTFVPSSMPGRVQGGRRA